MTLCRGQLKGWAGRSLLVSVMLLAGGLFIGGSAKAANNITVVGVSVSQTSGTNATATVPASIESTTSVLICSDLEPTTAGMTANGVPMTKAFSVDQRNNPNYSLSIFYLINPQANTNYLTKTVNADGSDYSPYYWGRQCAVISGVDTAGGWINTYQIPQDTFNQDAQYFNNAEKDKPVIIFAGGPWGLNPNTSTKDGDWLYNMSYNNGPVNLAFIEYPETDGALEFGIHYGGNTNGSNYAFMAVNPFMAVKPAPPAGVSITSQSYNPVTGKVTLTGACQQQGSGVNQMSLYAYDIGTSTPISSQKDYPERDQLVTCSNGAWAAIFDGSGLTGSNRLVIDDTFYGTTMASVDVNWQTVTGFIKFDYGASNIIPIDTTPSDGATTTLNFTYNICDDPDYSATSSKIYLGTQYGDHYQNDNLSANSNYYQATTCSGTGKITFHIDHGYTGAFRAYYAYANSYNYVILKSGYFYVNATYTPGGLKSSTSFDLFGSSTHDLACSEAEWNATNTNWIGINGTQMKCTAIQATLDTVAVINNFFIKLLSDLMNKVGANIFPLTIPIRIYDSWQASANTALPQSIQWLDIADAEGNIYYSFPKEWTGQATDTKIPIWGKNVFGSNNASLLFFAHIRSFITFVLWATFAWSFYNMAHEFYDEYMVEKTKSDRRKEDYQL